MRSTCGPIRYKAGLVPSYTAWHLEWVENGNRILDPGSGQLRPEIVALLKPLRIPVWRFPGGILADYYSWRDGIGPRASRPKRQNPMDGSVHENNFGTDEFIQLCRALGAEALITANYGTGTLADTLAWQKYFADHQFPVRYWEIGNEIYLTESSKNASVRGNDARIFHADSDYASAFQQWSSALRAADPNALVGAVAGTREHTSSAHRDWLNVILASDGRDVDFVALHNAFAPRSDLSAPTIIAIPRSDPKCVSRHVDPAAVFGRRYQGGLRPLAPGARRRAGPHRHHGTFPTVRWRRPEGSNSIRSRSVSDAGRGALYGRPAALLHAGKGLDGQLQHRYQ